MDPQGPCGSPRLPLGPRMFSSSATISTLFHRKHLHSAPPSQCHLTSPPASPSRQPSKARHTRVKCTLDVKFCASERIPGSSTRHVSTPLSGALAGLRTPRAGRQLPLPVYANNSVFAVHPFAGDVASEDKRCLLGRGHEDGGRLLQMAASLFRGRTREAVTHLSNEVTLLQVHHSVTRSEGCARCCPPLDPRARSIPPGL